MNTLGQNIKEARIAAGLTQADLAEVVFVSPGSISHYETGRKVPSSKTLLLIAKAVGKSVDELEKGENKVGRQRVKRKDEDFPEIDEEGRELLRRIWNAITLWVDGKMENGL